MLSIKLLLNLHKFNTKIRINNKIFSYNLHLKCKGKILIMEQLIILYLKISVFNNLNLMKTKAMIQEEKLIEMMQIKEHHILLNNNKKIKKILKLNNNHNNNKNKVTKNLFKKINTNLIKNNIIAIKMKIFQAVHQLIIINKFKNNNLITKVHINKNKKLTNIINLTQLVKTIKMIMKSLNIILIINILINLTKINNKKNQIKNKILLNNLLKMQKLLLLYHYKKINNKKLMINHPLLNIKIIIIIIPQILKIF